MVSIESSQKTIKEIFYQLDGNKQFEIPLYQREYSWNWKNWEEFLHDFERSYKNRNTTDYWGNILVYDDGENYQIIDGQQRLITLIIFIHSLGKKIDKNNILPLRFKDNELNIFWESLFTLNDDGDPVELKINKDKSIYKAYNYFKNQLKNKKKNMKTRYYNFLLNTQLTLVILQNEMESYLLFGRLNTRGLLLNDIDLIKYEIFQNTSRTTGLSGSDQVLENWRNIQKVIQNCSMNFDNFLTSWFEVKYNIDTKNTYRAFLDKIDKADYLKVLTEILKTAQNILYLIEDNSGSKNRIKRNLEYMIKLSISPKIYNVVITIADTAFDRKIKLVEVLMLFEFVRAVTSTNSKIEVALLLEKRYDYEKIDEAYCNFSKSMANLRKYSAQNEIDTEIVKLTECLLASIPLKEDFIFLCSHLRHGIKKPSSRKVGWEADFAEYAIFTLNNWLEVKNPTDGEDYQFYDDKDYSVEHIINKSFGENENAFQFKLGNLMTLEEQINHKLSSEDDLSKKVKEYQDSKYFQIQEFLDPEQRKYSSSTMKNNNFEWNWENFSEEAVENRGRYLGACFYDKLELLLNQLA